MGVDDLEWDSMANGTIALKFNMEQVWMACQNIKIYRLSTPTPTSTCVFTNSTLCRVIKWGWWMVDSEWWMVMYSSSYSGQWTVDGGWWMVDSGW
jgi:hypothetical protein